MNIDLNKNSFCLTVNEKQYQYFCEIFKKYDLPIPKKFPGISFLKERTTACSLGHLGIVMMAKALELPYVIIFEDDAYPCINAKKQLDSVLKTIPNDCGVLSLGRNGYKSARNYNDQFIIIEEEQHGAQAYIVFQKAYDDLLINSFKHWGAADYVFQNKGFSETLTVYNTKHSIFLQKNIDLTCMAGTSRWIFNEGNGLPQYFELAPENFHDDLDIDEKFGRIFVNYKNTKKLCYIDFQNNFIQYHLERWQHITGKLIPIKENLWHIQWLQFPQLHEMLILNNNKFFIADQP